jgi:hypothetical protein
MLKGNIMSVLFDFFSAANNGQFSYVLETETSELSPYVMLGWFHGESTNTNIHTITTANYVNEFVFSLAKHPKLLLMLFIAANCNIDSTRYKYVKSSGNTEKRAVVKMIAEHYQCGYNEASEVLPMLSQDDLAELNALYAQ